jgi:predicted dinucleotide-binding enzyme
MSVGEAVRFADVLMLALPWRNFTGLPSPSDLSGKVVIDAMNPYGPDGTVLDLGPTTSSEEVARRLPGARLVKAFNTIYFSTLATRGRPDRPLSERLSIFVAGDDTAAKRVVEDLIVQIGFAPIDTGSLREGGRRQQPGSAVYAAELTPAGARAALAQSAASAPSPSP